MVRPVCVRIADDLNDQRVKVVLVKERDRTGLLDGSLTVTVLVVLIVR